jgi:glycosyltransferase involved in cell wall biosynthesis
VHVLPYTTSTGLDLDHRVHDEPIIGFAGRLLPYKGVDLILDGLALLPARDRPHFEIAGSGPDEPRLRHLADHLGLAGSVTWLGELDQDALAERRRSWWSLAVPSRSSEGWGVVVNEALNSGVPVIASAHVHAASDLVRDERNGIVVPATRTEHPSAWADAIAASCDTTTIAERSACARRVGLAFAPTRAARWLFDLWSSPARDGASFVDDAWRSFDGVGDHTEDDGARTVEHIGVGGPRIERLGDG